MSTFTLVQPRARRREWELRRGDEIEQHGWWRPEHVVRHGRTDEEVARLRSNELQLGGRTLT